MKPKHIESKRNKKCHKCGNPMIWVEGLLKDGGVRIEVGRYACPKCRINMPQQESRAIKRGRRLAHVLSVDNVLDEKLTSHSTAEQIGYFRELQHCKKCENNLGDPCTCEGRCDCLCCQREGR